MKKLVKGLREKDKGKRKKIKEAREKGKIVWETQMLIMGVDLFKKSKRDLQEARDILNKYTDIYRAQRLLQISDELT